MRRSLVSHCACDGAVAAHSDRHHNSDAPTAHTDPKQPPNNQRSTSDGQGTTPTDRLHPPCGQSPAGQRAGMRGPAAPGPSQKKKSGPPIQRLCRRVQQTIPAPRSARWSLSAAFPIA